MTELLVLALFFGAASLTARLLWQKHISPDRFGVANWITLSRNFLVILIVHLLIFDHGSNEDLKILTLSLIVLAMDGLDGYFARKLDICSAFGARFDMESDAIFIMVLCVIIVLEHNGPLWVLLIGFMRYLYVLAQHWVDAMNTPVKERYSRKVICVVQVVALIIPLSGLVPAGVSVFLLALSLALLIFSFGRDIREQIKTYNIEATQ